VDFGENVSNCSYAATIGGPLHGAAPAPGYAVVTADGSDLNGVVIQTFNAAGVATNEGFHLAVDCVVPRTGCGTWAAVNGDGTLASTACPGATSSNSSAGEYYVQFTKNVSHCAFTATVGTNALSSGESPGPAVITVAGGVSNVKAVFVAITVGTTLTDEPFFLTRHLLTETTQPSIRGGGWSLEGGVQHSPRLASPISRAICRDERGTTRFENRRGDWSRDSQE
jgi:hypothetical protein